MTPLFAIRLAKGLAALAAGFTLATAAQAQTAGAINTFVLPFGYYALAATGEPVTFSGSVTFETQRITDPTAGDQLLVKLFWTNVAGTASPSLTRYVVTGSENVVLPHASSQTMEITFPLVPEPGSKVMTTRTGVANITFLVSLTTGAFLGLSSAVISIK